MNAACYLSLAASICLVIIPVAYWVSTERHRIYESFLQVPIPAIKSSLRAAQQRLREQEERSQNNGEHMDQPRFNQDKDGGDADGEDGKVSDTVT